MDSIYADLSEMLRRPAVAEMALDVLLCAVPIWLAVMIGLVIGWSWRPRWTGLLFLGLRSKVRFTWTAVPPGLGARRLWLAFTALSAFSVCSRLWANFNGKGKTEVRGGDGTNGEAKVVGDQQEVSVAADCGLLRSSPVVSGIDEEIVTAKDLDHLLNLLDEKVGESFWQSLMERKTSNMIYQAWRHEPEVGPIMYRSRTVFEDATPELVKDFFWDDDFRLKWDPMLAHFKVLEEAPHTGEMIVHWIKKFPFFCSDREYIMGRRIWESGKTFYCVTKGVPYPALRKSEKPRRVELYFSSWRIKAVESRKQDGQLSACEVTLVHYEDMGIPKDVAKVGVRHGMWGAVKKVQSGMRAYQITRRSEMPLSGSALLAQITTKIPADLVLTSESELLDGERDVREIDFQKKDVGIDWRWIAIGGAVAVACGLQTGVLGKALMFGAARRLQRK